MALMTGAAVMAALWPLSRRPGAHREEVDGDLGFYRDQLKEIDREVERGLIPAAEAESARAETGRRLLRAHDGGLEPAFSMGEPALRRRRAAAAFSLSVVPLIALAVYGALGSPQAPSSAPSRTAAIAEGGAPDLDRAIAQVEQHLASNPGDGRGWDVIAPVYLRSGRFADAASAFATARRLSGDTVDRLSGQAEALVAVGAGVVSAEASTLFGRALALDAGAAKARFYLALAAEQDGDISRARSEYQTLLASAPADAPWARAVEARLVGLQGGAAATLPEAAQTPDIQAMVQGLDERLSREGGSEAEWSRLVRSFVVLGRPGDAKERLSRARVALAGEPQAIVGLDRLGQELGLTYREAAR